MANLVVVHAHPDDESIQTGGTMAKAAADGHRVTLVVATRGEHGEVVPGVLDEGEQLGIRRIDETFDHDDLLREGRLSLLGEIEVDSFQALRQQILWCLARGLKRVEV